jgi:iron(III) transport system ATP-binding protein
VRKLRREAIRTRVREVLELVEMAAYEQRYPHQLSGGQQQRVALARALVYSPSVLLLDEPFSNLDAKLRERARAWVKELQVTLGLTTIFVTHDQDEALSMSDRVAVMSAGEVQQIGTPEEIYRHPANRFVAEFVGRVNLIEGLVSGGEQGGLVVDVTGSSHRLAVHDGAGASGNITVAVRPEAVTVMRLDDRSVNGTNTWEADVETVSFLGDHYEYEVSAGSVALTVQSAHRVEGDRIRVHIPPGACAVVE